MLGRVRVWAARPDSRCCSEAERRLRGSQADRGDQRSEGCRSSDRAASISPSVGQGSQGGHIEVRSKPHG